MSDTLNKQVLTAMIDAAVKTIEENFDLLSQLDSATGDGDHGVAIRKTITAAQTAIQSNDGPLKDVVTAVGWGVMSEGAGSAGPLLGAFFMGMADGCTSDELDAAQTAAAFEAALAGMQQHSKAEVGDKTMMDAVIPAIGAMKGGTDIPTMFRAAADAAVAGAEASIDMVAKFGRARNLGERSKGHMDAGAKSLSLIFTAFADAVA